ncbi:acyltransferase [Cellulomonas sp. zg-ZUI22]|uniref:acyltransferase family protein n=1 Tax=Cellulomonas sp. zg-ZUI22 TaxID=2816955 RepID=UPI001A943EDD|nr:acyltransferase family protein [Cellulomonas sp. zg-ZUI22]MBO0899861.1 acyltransferase [Cellulomonas sp. zg-ZUI22]
MTSPAPRTAPSVATRPRRQDLDGLRAVAVALVAVYHVWTDRVSGGVDVFLLISGYFVVGGLLRAFAAGRPVELRTYLPRLARRLLPALLTVLAGVVVATALLLPATRWRAVATESVTSTLYVQNWYLLLTGREYAAVDPAGSPLQHLWSMSVQGQLFVAVPALLLLVWWITRRRAHEVRVRAVQGTVVALTVLSAVWAAVAVRLDQPAAYYDTAARAWEYLAGAVLALVVTRMRRPLRGAPVLGTAGLVLLLASGLLVDGGHVFPGPAALVPLTAAALVVLAGAGDGPPRGVARLLGARPLAEAGRRAYAFYLWHWPVLVIAVTVRGRGAGWMAGTAVLLVSAVLAWATHRFVEAPLHAPAASAPTGRRALHRPRPGLWHPVGLARRVVAVSVVVALVVPVSWSVHREVMRQGLMASSLIDDVATRPGALAVLDPIGFPVDPTLAPLPAPVDAVDDIGPLDRDGCTVGGGRTEVRTCVYGDPDADRTIAVVGGSHAEPFAIPLDLLGQEEGFRVVTMIRWSCSLVVGTAGVEKLLERDPTCPQWSARAMSTLEELDPDVVLTTATRPDESPSDRREHVPDAYLRAWQRLEARGIQVVGVRDTPWVGNDPPECVAVHGPDPEVCSTPAADILDDPSPLLEVDSRTSSAIRFIDINDVLCADGRCDFVQGGRLVYRDGNHLTATYAMSLAPVFRERLGSILLWW